MRKKADTDGINTTTAYAYEVHAFVSSVTTEINPVAYSIYEDYSMPILFWVPLASSALRY
jgi:hypothetical protein